MIQKRPSLRRVTVTVTMSLVALSAMFALPAPGFAHRHEKDVCGPDINEFAAGLLVRLAPGTAHADKWELGDEGDACGLLVRKTTFVNESDFPAEHTFIKGHTKKTEYSVQVSGGFKGAFEAKMGYKSDNTATEEFRSRVRIPRRRGAELSAAPSLHMITGMWRHGAFHRHKTPVQVARPTGHIKWVLRNVAP